MEPTDNRANILNCALRLFAARGYGAVGVQEIVEAAGVTKPTLYHYFGNKHGLLEALLDRYFDELYQLIAPVAVYQGDIRSNINRLVATFFDFAQANPTVYRLQLALWFAPPDSEPNKVVARLNLRQHELLEELFKAAAADHGNMRGRQQAYAVTFLGMINTYIGMALNGYVELDEALAKQAARQFMYGIFS